MILFDQYGREIQTEKRPETREIAVATVRDRWSSYPSQGLTPGSLAAIFKEADGGDVYRQAELFEEMEEKDTHLFSEFQTRKNAVVGLDYDVVPYSESSEDKKISEFVAENLMNLDDLEDALLDLLDAIGKGYALAEISWKIDGQKALIGALHWIHPKKAIFYEVSPGMWDKSYEVPKIITETEPFKGEALPPFKLIYHRYKARSGYDTRAGLLRTCSWMYLFKNYAIKDWVAFAEVFGMPLRLGKYEASASKGDKDALIAAIQSLGSDAAGIISKNTEIEFIETTKNTGKENMHQALADFCNKEMSKAILGQTATTEGTPGKLGNEDAQDRVRNDLIKSDSEALAKTLRFQLMRPLVGYNFGWDKPLPWFKFRYEPPEDLTALSTVYKNLYEINFPLTQEHVADRFKVPLPEKDQTVLARTPEPAFDNLTAAKSTRVSAKTAPQGDDPGGEGTSTPFTPAQQAVEYLVARVVDQHGIMDPLLTPVLELVAKAGSYQEILEKLYSLYPKIDSSRMQELINQSMFAADVWGYVQSRENKV